MRASRGRIDQPAWIGGRSGCGSGGAARECAAKAIVGLRMGARASDGSVGSSVVACSVQAQPQVAPAWSWPQPSSCAGVPAWPDGCPAGVAVDLETNSVAVEADLPAERVAAAIAAEGYTVNAA